MTRKSTNQLILILLALTFVFVILRSFLVPFTIDESISFSIYNDSPIFKNTANHHLLNTLWMQLSSSFFGPYEGPMRFLNVIGFGLYIYASYQFLIKIENNWIKIFGTILLVFNPYFIEFFSLARGYGISTGCIMMSIYFLLHPKFKSKNGFFSFISICFGLFALFANYGSINFLFALIPLIVYRIIQSNEKLKLSILKIAIILTLTSIFSWIAVKQLLILSQNDELYFGENSIGFTINSVIQSWIYYPKPWITGGVIFKYTMLIIVGLSMIYSFLKLKLLSIEVYLTILLSFIIAGLCLEHLLFNAKFPTLRTTMYLFPITALIVVFSMSNLTQLHIKLKSLIVIVSIILSITISLIFLKNINFTHTLDWKFEKNTKEVSMIIDNDTTYMKFEKTIGNHWLFEPTINYYRISRKLMIPKTTREQYTFSEKYIYDFKSNLSKIPNDYKILKEFNDIETVLLIKKN